MSPGSSSSDFGPTGGGKNLTPIVFFGNNEKSCTSLPMGVANYTSWWLQPEKYDWNWIISPGRGKHLKPPPIGYKWDMVKTRPDTFHEILVAWCCLIGILIMVFYDPHISGYYNPLYLPSGDSCLGFACSMPGKSTKNILANGGFKGALPWSKVEHQQQTNPSFLKQLRHASVKNGVKNTANWSLLIFFSLSYSLMYGPVGVVGDIGLELP